MWRAARDRPRSLTRLHFLRRTLLQHHKLLSIVLRVVASSRSRSRSRITLTQTLQGSRRQLRHLHLLRHLTIPRSLPHSLTMRLSRLRDGLRRNRMLTTIRALPLHRIIWRLRARLVLILHLRPPRRTRRLRLSKGKAQLQVATRHPTEDSHRAPAGSGSTNSWDRLDSNSLQHSSQASPSRLHSSSRLSKSKIDMPVAQLTATCSTSSTSNVCEIGKGIRLLPWSWPLKHLDRFIV